MKTVKEVGGFKVGDHVFIEYASYDEHLIGKVDVVDRIEGEDGDFVGYVGTSTSDSLWSVPDEESIRHATPEEIAAYEASLPIEELFEEPEPDTEKAWEPQVGDYIFVMYAAADTHLINKVDVVRRVSKKGYVKTLKARYSWDPSCGNIRPATPEEIKQYIKKQRKAYLKK